MSHNPITKLWPSALGLLLSLAMSADAHVGDRVYPIAYLSDEMLERIDLEDGLVDEWYDLVGEPTMTLLDFTEEEMGMKPDPSDLDFRIWLGWHDDPARFYVAFQGSDDDYKNDLDYSSESPASSVIILQDCIVVALDGDHSGGAGCLSCSEEDWLDEHGNTQVYWAIARTPSGPVLDLPFPRYYFPTQVDEFAWTILPPLAHGGGGVAGENPTISVIEVYVTPLDSWAGQHSPEEVVVSDWAAGQIVGFGVGVADREKSGEHGVTWTPEAMQASEQPQELPVIELGFLLADRFIDGILLSADPGGSVIESVSWGRIKASLW